MEDIPYDQVRREMVCIRSISSGAVSADFFQAEGIARPSMAKAAADTYLENGTLTEEIEDQIKGAAGILYVGGYYLRSVEISLYELTHTLVGGTDTVCGAFPLFLL